MYEESLLEPMGEISYEDRESTKVTYNATISSTLSRPHPVKSTNDELIEKENNSTQSEISIIVRDNNGKSVKPPDLNDTNSMSDSAAKLLDLQRVKHDDDNSNSNQSITLKQTTTSPVHVQAQAQPRLVPMDKLIRKDLISNSSTKDESQTSTTNTKHQKEKTRYVESVDDGKNNSVNDFLSIEMGENEDEIEIENNTKEIDYKLSNNDNEHNTIKIKDARTCNPNEYDDQMFLLQPMSEVPFSEDEQINPADYMQTEHTIGEYNDEFNSDAEFLETSSTEGYSDFESDETESTHSSNKKKRRKKSKIPKMNEIPTSNIERRVHPKISYDESSNDNTIKKRGRRSKGAGRRRKSKQSIDGSQMPSQQFINERQIGKIYEEKKDKSQLTECPPTAEIVFGRQSGDIKIDSESGGQIVFQSKEITVVNKINKIKSEIPDERLASSTTVSQDSFDEVSHKAKCLTSDIEIVPLNRKKPNTSKLEPSLSIQSLNTNNSDQYGQMAVPSQQCLDCNRKDEHTESQGNIVADSIEGRKKPLRKSSGVKMYCEWSENSMDQLDLSTAEKPRKMKKPHWKTLLKQQQNNMEKSSVIDLPSVNTIRFEHSSNKPDTNVNIHSDAVSVANETEASAINNLSITDTPNSVNTLDTPVPESIEKSIPGDDEYEDSTIRKKRVRKLKFGSYTFTEKRDPNKPKMVLKYRRKTKRLMKRSNESSVQKPKLSITSESNVLQGEHIADGLSLETKPIISSSTAPADDNTTPGRKKPGPKKGWKLQRQLIDSMTKQKENFEKSPIKKSLKIEPNSKVSRTDEEIASTSSTGKSKHLIKQKRKAEDVGAESSSDDGDMELKRRKRKEAAVADQSSNQYYLENYNQVLQDRNKVLLEILEQRSSEIRDLKLRVSNLVKTSEGSIEVERKEENDRGPWTNAELAKGYCLQKLSKPFYRYVQRKFALPLPNESEIENYISDVRIGKGVLIDILQILENNGEIMNDTDRVTVLQISKIQTTAIYEYDRSSDSILGKHSEMIVIVARGLYSEWNQPVYINFNVNNMKDYLNDIIRELHKIKYAVVACVCNYTENKSDIWKEFDVSMGCNYFSHPITTDFIYAFYYMDDILCAIRDHFIGEGFTLDMKPINADPLRQLIEEKHDNLPVTDEAMEPNCTKMNRLQYAIDIFSKETVKFMKLFLPANDSALNCINFIELIESFYHLMNSSRSSSNVLGINSSIYSSSSNGGKGGTNNQTICNSRFLEDQSQILSEVQLNFYRLKCPGIERMSEFQRATMMTIESTKMLLHSTKQKYKIDFFSLQSITQDYLKYNFEQTSQLSPLDLFNALRILFIDGNRIKPEPIDNGTDSIYKFFLSESIDSTKSENYYVQRLLEWIFEQHKIKHPFSAISQEESQKRLEKFEEAFQAMQNPIFNIKEEVFAKMMKKFKGHPSGMSTDMLQLFIVQRHLLRMKYINSIDVKVEVKGEDD